MPDLELCFREIISKCAVGMSDLLQISKDADFAYISDPETYDLLYTYSHGKTMILKNGEVPKKCYKEIYGLDSPCPFCSTSRLYGDCYQIWRRTDEKTGLNYVMKDKWVTWKKRKARLSLALSIDSSDDDKTLIESLLARNFLINCLQVMNSDSDFGRPTALSILHLVCDFFAADDGAAFFTDNPDDVIRYVAAGAKQHFAMLNLFMLSDGKSLLQEMIYGKKLFFVDGVDNSPLSETVKKALKDEGINSLLLVPVFSEQRLAGMYLLFNCKKNKSQVSAFDMIFSVMGKSIRSRDIKNQNALLRYSDPLTGYLNFEGFKKDAAESIAKSFGQQWAVFYSDIKNFKYINDMFGYAFGDRLLRYWAQLLSSQLKEGEVFGRVAGDTMVGLRSFTDRQELVQRFFECVASLNDFVNASGRKFTVVVSSGIYVIEPGDERSDINTLVDRANIAQKNVKPFAGNQISYFTDNMRNHQLRVTTICQSLQSAIAANEIEVYYQPQYDYTQNRLIGAEALARWYHPEYGWLSPSEFIPMLEQNGGILDLDMYVCEKVCKFMRDYSDKVCGGGEFPVPLSINLSRMDFYNFEFGGRIEQIVKNYGISTSRLNLEITESAYTENPQQIIRDIQALKKLGFKVEMDDFGSGYSSLNTLREMPIDILKLDLRFLEGDSGNNSRGGSILNSVVRMAHWLKLFVIAEGVETKQQAEYLSSIGCRYMQGYYFSKPVAESEFVRILNNTKSVVYQDLYESIDMCAVEKLMDCNGADSYVFNNCLEGAALLEYSEGTTEVMLANRKMSDLLGLSDMDELLYRDATKNVIEADDRRMFIESLDETVRLGESSCIVRRRAVKDGDKSTVWIRFSFRLLSDNMQKYMLFAQASDVSACREQQIQSMTEQLADTSALYAETEKQMLDGLPVGGCILKLDSGGGLVTQIVNGETRRLLNLSQEENLPAEVLQEILPHENSYDLPQDGEYREKIIEITDGGKERRSVRCRARFTQNRTGEIDCYVMVSDCTDFTTQRKELQWREAQLSIMSEISMTAMYDYDCVTDTLTVYTNAPLEGTVLHTFRNLRTKFPILQYIHPDFVLRLKSTIERLRSHCEEGSSVTRLDCFGLGKRYCRLLYKSIADDNGTVYRIVGRIDDIDDETKKQRCLERELRDRAQKDGMTGFLNRTAVAEVINRRIDKENGGTMFLVDIDDFKLINDRLGHLSGDQAIRELSSVLENIFRSDDIFGRVGGDEFVVYLPNMQDAVAVADKAQSILDGVARIRLPGGAKLGCSVGAIIAGADYKNFEELYGAADIAMYEVKNSGKAKYSIHMGKRS